MQPSATLSSSAQIGTILNCDTAAETSGHDQADAQVDKDHLSDMTSANDIHTHTHTHTHTHSPSQTQTFPHPQTLKVVDSVYSGVRSIGFWEGHTLCAHTHTHTHTHQTLQWRMYRFSLKPDFQTQTSLKCSSLWSWWLFSISEYQFKSLL